MSTKRFSEAMGEIDDRYIEKAIAYQAKKSSASYPKRWLLPLVAAIMTVLLIGTAVAAVVIYGDLWRQKPSNDPVESVRSALENQVGKDYTIKIEVNSVEVDEAETERVVERFIKGIIAERRGWSDEYLAEHFLVVKAVYYAEYDHAQTTRSDGEVTMYFYLTQDVDSGKWTIVDNSGNVNWSENSSMGESVNPAIASNNPADESTEEQLFSYLSELFTEAYSPYYDGLRYEMNDYKETADGTEVTATFLLTMYHLGKGWDVGTDEGVDQQVSWKLQATVTAHEDGTLDFETISVFSNSSPVGPASYDIPIEEEFPTQLAD